MARLYLSGIGLVKKKIRDRYAELRPRKGCEMVELRGRLARIGKRPVLQMTAKPITQTLDERVAHAMAA